MNASRVTGSTCSTQFADCQSGQSQSNTGVFRTGDQFVHAAAKRLQCEHSALVGVHTPAAVTIGAARGRGHAPPPPRNWVHKKIPGCAVELNTQNFAWFGSQISLITAMSFREAMPPPRTTHQGLCPWTPLGDFRSPDPLCTPTSKSWLRHWS